MAAIPHCIGSRQAVPFAAPAWAAALRGAPQSRLQLGHFPTPLVQWRPLEPVPPGVEFWLKRDDLSGMELSGNKVRKLEFLLADALRQGADCVVSCGGMQSNHCRAVAVAACALGLESHLVLRHEDRSIEDAEAACADVGLSGNLLVNRMVGAKTWVVTKKEYRERGSPALLEHVRGTLVAEGRVPYVIPLGGSNPIGTWGYVTAFEELRLQAEQMFGRGEGFSSIVLATGSGGSLLGIALGNRLSGMGAKVWGFGASDSPAWHHGYIDSHLLSELLPAAGADAGLRSEDLAEIRSARNLGYAESAPEELRTIREIARRTGVLLDPVYSGKAFHCFAELYRQSPELFGKRVLFWHTGGLFGLWDKQAQLLELIESGSPGDVVPMFPPGGERPRL